MTKTAVVLFNLGGPDTLDAVRPFLFNLFNDPAIIGLPGPLRWLVAQMASRKRAKLARDIYRQIGGGSPILSLTNAQAEQLEQRLREHTVENTGEAKVFVAMRYWHPLVSETARAVAAYAPDQVVLLPLYPQFSTTTTGSSLAAWDAAARDNGLKTTTRAVCCYPTQKGFIQAQVSAVSAVLESVTAAAESCADLVVLFSAHGLPEKIVAGGDPYDWQVEQTVAAIVEQLRATRDNWSGLECRVCYQSRVGPLKWIGPGTEETIIQMAKTGRHIVVVPIAFVSEHSETLVELDIEYRKLAEEYGAAGYSRVPALGTSGEFIDALAEMVRLACAGEMDTDVQSAAGARTCPVDRDQCPMKMTKEG